MSRTLSDVIYSEGILRPENARLRTVIHSIAVVRALPENPEWGLVGEFGGHECTLPLKPVAKFQQRSVGHYRHYVVWRKFNFPCIFGRAFSVGEIKRSKARLGFSRTACSIPFTCS